jgi:Tfp pilus assembly protein PilO
MVIICLLCVGIVLAIGLAFWCWNSWSSLAEDRKETATLRSGRQAVAPNTMKRGTDTD